MLQGRGLDLDSQKPLSMDYITDTHLGHRAQIVKITNVRNTVPPCSHLWVLLPWNLSFPNGWPRVAAPRLGDSPGGPRPSQNPVCCQSSAKPTHFLSLFPLFYVDPHTPLLQPYEAVDRKWVFTAHGRFCLVGTVSIHKSEEKENKKNEWALPEFICSSGSYIAESSPCL